MTENDGAVLVGTGTFRVHVARASDILKKDIAALAAEEERAARARASNKCDSYGRSLEIISYKTNYNFINGKYGKNYQSHIINKTNFYERKKAYDQVLLSYIEDSMDNENGLEKKLGYNPCKHFKKSSYGLDKCNGMVSSAPRPLSLWEKIKNILFMEVF